MVEFNFGPVFEHSLERGAGSLCGFRLWNRQVLVRIHKGIGTLRQRHTHQQKKQKAKKCSRAQRTGYAM
jgi:hypothetical protein